MRLRHRWQSAAAVSQGEMVPSVSGLHGLTTRALDCLGATQRFSLHVRAAYSAACVDLRDGLPGGARLAAAAVDRLDEALT